MENEETILADEQTNVDVQEETTETESNDDYVDVDAVKSVYESELTKKQKEIDRLAKFEARYKSQMKAKETTKQVESKADANVDLNSLVEQKIAEISERKAFKEAHGEDIFNDVLKIKEKHPTLSLEEALKFSPIANDPARTANPDQYSSPGRANLNSGEKSITYEKLSKLSQSEYNIMSEKVKSGEVKLIMN